VQGDYINVIQKLQNKDIHDTFVGLLIRDILLVTESFQFYFWFDIKRGDNKIAYELAH